jgi:hypothetical protein
MGLGRVRRSQVVTTYGPGSLVAIDDESFMVTGIDSWFDGAMPDAGIIHEPRLEKFLNVTGFVLPPSGASEMARDIPVVRYPYMYSCSSCKRLAPYFKLATDTGFCSCGGRLRTSRFIAICEAGHAMEFPYSRWVHRGQAVEGMPHDLRLMAEGRSAGLSDLIVSCSCGMSRSMEGALSKNELRNVTRCAGARPWLPGVGKEENCDKIPRGSQRGASNVWQGVTQSSLSIPPWSREVNRFIDQNWMVLQAVPANALVATVNALCRAFPVRFREEEVVAAIEDRRRLAHGENIERGDMFRQEYDALCRPYSQDDEASDFVCERVGDEVVLSPGIEYISRVKRLREVRALDSFYRMTSGSDGERIACELGAARSWWLPAIEVSGEGVFIKFDEERLRGWESDPRVSSRMRHARTDASGMFGLEELPAPSARAALIHTVSHVLMDQWSLECGYPTASLRERIYVGEDMAGVLIYTATSDSQGSMGGVVGMSKGGRFEASFASALARAEWCSNDPVCMERGPNGFGGLNRAACHSCCHVPETSCTWRNTLLDRALIIGSSDGCPGFFER